MNIEKRWGVVIFLHGYGEYAGKYGWYAKMIANEGFDVYGVDYKGHGLTQ